VPVASKASHARARLFETISRALRGLFVGVVFLASAENASARAPASAGSRPSTLRLENGLEVVLDSDPEDASVAVVLTYDAGSRRDPPGYQGLAHLVEHLTYRGSRHLPAHGIFEQLERVGALNWNGVTSIDYVAYYCELPSQHVTLPLWLESERMAFTLEKFTTEALELERQRVKKELMERRVTRKSFELYIFQALFPEGHPCRPRPLQGRGVI
jgi:zinc protease